MGADQLISPVIFFPIYSLQPGYSDRQSGQSFPPATCLSFGGFSLVHPAFKNSRHLHLTHIAITLSLFNMASFPFSINTGSDSRRTISYNLKNLKKIRPRGRFFRQNLFNIILYPVFFAILIIILQSKNPVNTIANTAYNLLYTSPKEPF